MVRLRDEERRTFTEIAERLDLSPSRIGQLYHGAHHKIQFPPNGLSRKLNRLLARAGFTIEKEAIIQALRAGKLYPYCCPPNYGKYAHRDVCRWAGVDPATLPQDWPDHDRSPPTRRRPLLPGAHAPQICPHPGHESRHHRGLADRRTFTRPTPLRLRQGHARRVVSLDRPRSRCTPIFPPSLPVKSANALTRPTAAAATPVPSPIQ